MTPNRETLETIAQDTLPIPVGVSGLTLLGFTLQDWVFVGTALLLIFQLAISAPKAYRSVKSFIKMIKRRFR